MSDAPPDSVKVRRFPRPWRIAESNAAFWVTDAEGKSFGYCYFVDKVQIATDVGKLTRAEALVIVRNIVKLAG